MSNGYLLYDGPSRLVPSRDIIVLATGFKNPSANVKTGPMIQTWILDKKEKPTDAIKSLHDESVCGDCPFRGTVCYVQVGQAPNSIWNAYTRGRYPHLGRADYERVFNGRKVRFGAYGDPCAAPAVIWGDIALHSSGHTGYTHQWRRPDSIEYSAWLMASTDDKLQSVRAQEMGWRTFRVSSGSGESRLPREVVCPASEEAGKLLTCDQCLACSGSESGRKGSIVIDVHGSAASQNAYHNIRGELH